MGIFKAIGGAVGGTLADQWKDIITPSTFDEHTVVVPGIIKSQNNGRGSNNNGSEGVISNGSKIYIPENTAAFVFNAQGIENILTDPGEYEYQDGEESIFNGDGFKKSIIKQAVDRVGYGGISSMEKHIAYVNLREIRDIKFGTRGPQMYNDIYYNCDLEIYAYGSYTIQVVEPIKFIRNFVPANTMHYSFDDPNVRAQTSSEFMQSFIVALNSLSSTYRISHLPSKANEISNVIATDQYNAGTWEERFGFKIGHVSIENIEFSPQSRELVNKYNDNKMGMQAFEEISQKASNIAAQQKIAQGVENHGLGDMGGMLFGMNMAQGLNPTNAEVKDSKPTISLDEQIEALKKLKDLVDCGILSQEEFDKKKKEIMGL